MRYSKVFGKTSHNLPKGHLEKGQAYLIQGGSLHCLKEGDPILLPIGREAWNNLLQIVRKHLQKIDVQEVEFPLPSCQEVSEEQSIRQVNDQYLLSSLIELVDHHISSYRDLPAKLGYSRVLDDNRSCLLNSQVSYAYTVFSVNKDNEEQKRISTEFKEALPQIFSSVGVQSKELAFADSGENELGFTLLSETSLGRDRYFRCNQCDYIAPRGLAESSFPTYPQDEEQKPLKRIHGPDLISVKDLADFAGISVPTTTKTLIFETTDTKRLIVVMIRGDYDVSEAKLAQVMGEEVYLAPPQTIWEVISVEVGYSGVVGLPDNVELIADLTTEGRVNFECGANETDYHLLNVNFGRDVPEPEEFYDVRQMKEGETCKKCGKGELELVKAATLATYSLLPTTEEKDNEVVYTGEDGKKHPMSIGKLKIFPSTLFALALEDNWDDNGLIWPRAITPFHAHLISLGREDEIFEKAEEIYHRLLESGIEVLWDDRDKKPGVKFNDADLLGIPLRLTIGEKSYKENCVEVKERTGDEVKLIPEDEITQVVKQYYEE